MTTQNELLISFTYKIPQIAISFNSQSIRFFSNNL